MVVEPKGTAVAASYCLWGTHLPVTDTPHYGTQPFEDEDFDPSSVDSWVQGVVTILVQNDEIQDQVKANTKEQFRESQTIENAVTNAVLDHQDAQSLIMDKFFESAHRKDQIIKEISDLVYLELRYQAKKNQIDIEIESETQLL